MRHWIAIGIGVVLAIVLAVVALRFAFGSSEGPQVAKARAIVATVDDGRQAGNILNAGVAQQVPCGQIPKMAFDPHTGKARFWYARSPTDELLECFNSPGFSRFQEATALKEVTALVIKEILDKKEYYPEYEAAAYTKPPVQLYVAPPPVPTPTPLPDLSEWGPCCGR